MLFCQPQLFCQQQLFCRRRHHQPHTHPFLVWGVVHPTQKVVAVFPSLSEAERATTLLAPLAKFTGKLTCYDSVTCDLDITPLFPAAIPLEIPHFETAEEAKEHFWEEADEEEFYSYSDPDPGFPAH